MTPPVRLTAREADVGGLLIRRALPTRGKRLIGAWCFLDHLGPAELPEGPGLRVGPHPHTGLQTFTWMIDGEILHRDSLGSVQPIRPGQVNLMTAGHGISHSEESPAVRPSRLQAAQLWIALPDAVRGCAPLFEHYPDIPVVAHDGFRASVLVGEFLGAMSPVRVHTPLLGVDLYTEAATRTTVALRADFEYGALVLEGAAVIAGETLVPGSLLDLGTGNTSLALETLSRARILLLGGAPFEEDVLLFWNFVARSPGEVREFVRQWNAGDARFGEVRGYDGARLVAPEPPAGLKAPSREENAMHPVATATVLSAAPDFREEITTGNHALVSDEPAALGGRDAGPAPYDLVLAGLGSCTAITLRMYAQKKGWDIGNVSVDLTLTKNAAGDAHIARVIRSDKALTDEQWAKLLEIAGRTPVTKTLMAGSVIESRRG